jgi:hypothetical protein
MKKINQNITKKRIDNTSADYNPSDTSNPGEEV